MTVRWWYWLVLASALTAGACKDQVQSVKPQAVVMTEDALGHYCQMALSEHPGPKAQVHLDGFETPLFFSQVRDALAYKRMPEQSHRILAIYVSDMAKAASWESPGIDNWADADTVVYVVGSRAIGGMGAQELVPFSDRQAAATFAGKNGGTVQTLLEIPDSAVLSPVEFTSSQPEAATNPN